MPSTFTPNKDYELQATGENNGTWGVLLDAVLSQIDLNMGGRQAVTIDSSNVTLTSTQCRNVQMYLTGTLTGNRDLIFPATAGGFFLVYNNTSGAFTVTAKPSGGTGVVVPQGTRALVFVDPTLTAAYLYSTPSVLTTQGDILYRDANGVQRLAAGTSGQVLTTGGGGANPSWKAIGSGLGCFNVDKNGSSQAIGSTSSTKVTWGNELFDVGAIFSSDKVTPPSGKILLQCNIGFSSVTVGSSVYVYLYKNGSLLRQLDTDLSAATTSPAIGGSSIETANGTDYFEIYVQSTDSSYSIFGGTTLTWFSGTMLSNVGN